jgi:hypothetical protein
LQNYPILKRSKDSIRKLLVLIKTFSNVSGCKISTQKWVAFLYTNKEQSEKETVKFTIPSKNKIIAIGLTHEAKKKNTMKTTKLWRRKLLKTQENGKTSQVHRCAELILWKYHWVPVAHACNPSYLGGWDQEDHGSRPSRANSSWDPISKIKQ